MSGKRLYGVIDKEEPRGQSVSYQGIHCTARHCCTNLNRLTEENEQLKEENEQLKAKVKRLQDIATRTEVEKEEYADLYNQCRRYKLSDDEIKKAYADLNRRERENHSQGNATYVATMNQNEGDVLSEKRFTIIGQEYISYYGGDAQIISNGTLKFRIWERQEDAQKLCDLLNDQEQKIQRWKNLYEIKDAEVTARVDALNKVCEYYTSTVLFKSDVDPNRAVKEVINEILNTEVEM